MTFITSEFGHSHSMLSSNSKTATERQREDYSIDECTQSHLCRVAGNTMWSHMACDFP